MNLFAILESNLVDLLVGPLPFVRLDQPVLEKAKALVNPEPDEAIHCGPFHTLGINGY
jgi:hypothetical protein